MVYRFFNGKNTLEKKLFASTHNYYTATSEGLFTAPSLQRSLKCHTVIIGGGYAGLAVAIGLIERGQQDVIVLESETIGYGASGRNGGFVFGGYSLPDQHLLAKLGDQTGAWAYQQTTHALNIIKRRIEAYQIDCDANYSGIILANWFNETKALKQKKRMMESKFDTHWQWLDRKALGNLLRSERYHNGLLEQMGFHIHPLKYAKGLAKAIVERSGQVYENTPALSLTPHHEGFTVKTPDGCIEAEHCVIACGGYIGPGFRKISTAILPISTYVMVTEPIGAPLHQAIPTEAAVYDTRFAFDYYRKLPDERLLWGGRISTKPRNPKIIAALLLKDLAKVFPQFSQVKIDYAWGGLMGYPRHKMPILGQLENKLWHTIGYGGHGVAPTTAGGELICRGITEGCQDYRKLASFQFRPAFPPVGLLAAQSTYWTFQALDWIKEKRTR